MDFRIINNETLPKIMELWDYCFEKNDTPFFQWYFNEYCLKQNMIIGGFDEDNGQLMNMLHLNPYTINLRGQEVKLPYIVGVATSPEYRGKHLFGPLLDMTFAVLRAQEYAFVFLMPINAGIYRPYQFDYCYYRRRYEIPLAEIPQTDLDTSIALKRISLDDADVFLKVYNTVTAKYHGAVKRSLQNWKNLLAVHDKEQVNAVVAKRGENILGYMLYNISEKTFTIQELLAEETSARNAFLHFAGQHVTAAEKLFWLAEDWDKSYLNLRTQMYAGSLHPFMMARCIDIRKALEQYKDVPQKLEGELTLLISDKRLPINNGILRLSIGQGKLTVESTKDMHDVEMDIAAFTQLYFGQFPASELAFENKLKINKKEAAELLDRLFPKCNNYINEYF